MTAIERADACRRAGLDFMRGTAGDWGRRELALWLVGGYGACAIKVKDAHGAGSSLESDPIKSEALSDVLREARWKAFAELEDAMHGGARWIESLVAKGLVIKRAENEWAPVDRAGTRLRSRVLSLFAVDCLTRPADYKKLLLACPRCESVVFDERARREGRCCGQKVAGSGVRPRFGDDLRVSIPPAESSVKRKP